MLNSINKVVDAHDAGLKKQLLKQILTKYANRNESILSAGLLAALGIGTVENIIDAMRYLEAHPGMLSEEAEKDLIKGISIEFPLSGKL